MNTNILKLSILGVAGLFFASCDSFLDEKPSASTDTPISTAEQLLSLYDYAGNVEEQDVTGVYTTDDYEVPVEMYQASPSMFSQVHMGFYALQTEAMASSTSNSLWGGEYSKIFIANTIIFNIDEVSGTDAEKNEALCNAYFMRAWSLFKMATEYCLPYTEANKNTLGLSLRLGVAFTENIGRSSLEETFNQIFADIQKADELCVAEKVPTNKAWRTSKAAINGLLARIYMYMNDYDKALEYTNKSLALANGLYDFNTLGYTSSLSREGTDGWEAQTLENCETVGWSNYRAFSWTEWVYVRRLYLDSQWYCPSRELVALYDQQNDRRFTLFYGAHGAYVKFTVPYDWYCYRIFDDGRYIFSGITTAELLLNKAECMARTGDWQSALSVLTPLREARYNTGTATALTASNQNDALKVILEERRREMPFSSRLMDIKRFAVNDNPNDDVTITRNFYEVTTSIVDDSKPISISVKGDSKVLAIPIPKLEIQNSQGAIEQNPTE